MENFINLSGQIVWKPKDLKVKKRTSVYAIVIDNHRILIAKPHHRELWELPGGGQEKGEDDFQTLKREVLEETNYEILELGRLVKTIHKNFYADDIDEYYYNTGKYYLIAKYRVVEKRLVYETEDAKLIDLKDFDFKQMSSHDREIMKEFLNITQPVGL